MGERKGPVVWLLVTVALLASSAGVGCGSEPLDLTADQARGLILQQFPEADPIVISVTVEEQRASAQTEFNGEIVDFLFAADEAGWLLEGVEHKGQVYFIEDVGEGPQAREVMVPDYLAEDTEVDDAWGNRFTYFSEDGQDYTMVSFGPDREAGTLDDLILHSGEFVSPEENGQG